MGSAYHAAAWAYDVAFSWDVEDEVVWLLARLGSETSSLLEPFCGTARMFPSFLRRGVSVTGLDLSADMLRLARERLAREGLSGAELHAADAGGFELGRLFDGAICPINSFCCLRTPDAAARHLRAVAAHLRPDARYLVQVDLHGADDLRLGVATPQGSWEMERDGTRIRTTWLVADHDPATRLETHRCTFEILSGVRAGDVLSSEEVVLRWDWDAWSALLTDSPFRQVGAWDGSAKGRPALDIDAALDGRPLVWHELALL